MNDRKFVMGFDGGGTKTAAELCDPVGTRIAEASAGPSNFQVIGVETAARTILDLAKSCCQMASVDMKEIVAMVAGLTGAGREADQKRMETGIRAEAKQRGLGIDKVRVASDARIALEAAFSGAPGIIVIGGTGSIVFGKDTNGLVHRAGGWGRIIGDEGSGYAIGQEAFRALAKVHDGRIRTTALKDLMAKQLGLDSQEAIINALYKQSFDIASVAPIVMDAAALGDKVARSILTEAATDLVEVIGTVNAKMNNSRRRGGGRLPLAFVGSVLTNENWFSKKMRALVRMNLPNIRLQDAEAVPVHGASLLAIRLAEDSYE